MTTGTKVKTVLMITMAVAPCSLLRAKQQVQATQATQITQAAPQPQPVSTPNAPPADVAAGMAAEPAVVTPFGRIAEYVERLDRVLEAREKEGAKSFLGDPSKSALLDMIAAGDSSTAQLTAGDPNHDKAAIVAALRKQAATLKKTVDEIENWQKQLGRVQGRGAVDEMVAKAEQWNLECRYRRELHAQAVELIKCAEKMMLVRLMEVKEDRKALGKLLEILKSEQGNETGPSVAAEDASALDNGFEYYEVKADATLREISALPAVYSDPRLWHRLYAANRDRVPDLQADRNVPSGTILLVPGLITARNYDF